MKREVGTRKAERGSGNAEIVKAGLPGGTETLFCVPPSALPLPRSPFRFPRFRDFRIPSAFTLIELVLVMALLVTMLALAVPSLSSSLHQRNLEQEASRLLALTEYGRDEAAARGVPVIVWLSPDDGHFGVEVKKGFDADAIRPKEFVLNGAGLRFDPPEGGVASSVQGHGFNVAEFAPDGTLDPASVATLRINDPNRHAAINLTQTADGYGYQIVKEDTP